MSTPLPASSALEQIARRILVDVATDFTSNSTRWRKSCYFGNERNPTDSFNQRVTLVVDALLGTYAVLKVYKLKQASFEEFGSVLGLLTKRVKQEVDAYELLGFSANLVHNQPALFDRDTGREIRVFVPKEET